MINNIVNCVYFICIYKCFFSFQGASNLFKLLLLSNLCKKVINNRSFKNTNFIIYGQLFFVQTVKKYQQPVDMRTAREHSIRENSVRF